MDKLPVIFRKNRSKHPEVTAVFPTEPAALTDGSMMCYAHIGQHSGCVWRWYLGTRAAKPEEYADLLAELKQTYEEDETEPVELVVYQRIQPWMRDEYNKNVRRQRHPEAE